MLILARSTFGALDWAVLGVYFALLVGSGVWLSRLQRGVQDYFLAGRNMPAWAVAISVLASALSAATFLGVPQQTYTGNLAYLTGMLGVIVATLIVAIFFIPAFYKLNVTTVYELLEHRFGPWAKLAGSWTFIGGRVLASGARLYIAANALAYVMFGALDPNHLLIAVAVLTFVGILYTIFGGIETVIWTDVVQTGVFLVAILAAAFILLHKIPAGLGDIGAALANPPDGQASKLVFLDLSRDLSRPFTLWTAFTGVMLVNLAALGTDHDLVQRMLTCRSALQGSRSVILSTIISIPVVMLFMALGLLLWAFYRVPSLWAGGPVPELPAEQESQRVMLHFITTQMPPGMSGLMLAGLFAVGLGSLDSALNAMSAAFVSDVYRPARPGRSDHHYLVIGRGGVVVFGLALGGVAALCVFWQQQSGQTFIDLALGVMAFAYAGLLGVFMCALFTRRGSSASAVAALITGFLVTLAMEPALLKWLHGRGVFPAVTGELATFAWPWRMVIATAASFAVAILPRGRARVITPVQA